MPPFIDPVSLLLWLVVASLVILMVYAARLSQGIPMEKLRQFAVPLASVAAPMALLGGWMSVTWPLTGAANIVIGEPIMYFGFLLLAAAWSIAYKNKEYLRVLTLLACVGGLFLLVLAAAIIINGIGRPPASEPGMGQPPVSFLFSATWALAYACTGIGAICSRWMHRRTWQRIGTGSLYIALGIFGLQAVISTLSQVGMFANWLPVALR